jgi:hypothetical protein
VALYGQHLREAKVTKGELDCLTDSSLSDELERDARLLKCVFLKLSERA